MVKFLGFSAGIGTLALLAAACGAAGGVISDPTPPSTSTSATAATNTPFATAEPDSDGSDSAEANVYRDEELGIGFRYPGSWMEGAQPKPFRPCSGCTILGPAQPPHPYGIRLFVGTLPAEACGPGCYVPSIGHAQEGPERALTVARREARQVRIIVTPPVGLANETGEPTPYHETWTLIPLDRQALFLVAFYRDGDLVAEQETLSAYEALLASLRFE